MMTELQYNQLIFYDILFISTMVIHSSHQCPVCWSHTQLTFHCRINTTLHHKKSYTIVYRLYMECFVLKEGIMHMEEDVYESIKSSFDCLVSYSMIYLLFVHFISTVVLLVPHMNSCTRHPLESILRVTHPPM